MDSSERSIPPQESNQLIHDVEIELRLLNFYMQTHPLSLPISFPEKKTGVSSPPTCARSCTHRPLIFLILFTFLWAP